MRSDWEGAYLDGRSPTRQRARIQLMRGGLQVTTESGTTAWWPIKEIRQTQGRYAGEEVRLERGGNLPEALLIADSGFLASLAEIAPEATGRFHDPRGRQRRLLYTVLAGLAVVAVTGALYLWGIPALAVVMAARVPVAWEERLGAAIVEQMVPVKERCTDAARSRRITQILERLTSGLARTPYTFRVVVAADPMVNALATPGGNIVVFRGLLERTRTAEELAGVLAHEMQHVVQRHATREVVQHASTGLLLVALTGDITGVMAYGLESARALGTLQYSRLAEEEADREGMKLLLATGIDPAGMIAFFDGLEKNGSDGPRILKYLSTHPLTQDRVRRLREIIQQHGPTAPAEKLLADYDWSDIYKICPAARES